MRNVSKFPSNIKVLAILHATISQKTVICTREAEFMTECTNVTETMMNEH